MNPRPLHKITAETGRLLLGATFIFSGIVKAIDPVGGAIKIEEYLTAFGLNHLAWLDLTLSIAQATFEFTLGCCLLLAAYRRITTLTTLAFMALMTPLTLYLALFNPVADCGCFGDAWIITNRETFLKNILLTAAAIAAWTWRRHLTPLYTNKARWFIPLFAAIFSTAFSLHNYNHLPIVDFRPYKIGKNIPQMMEIPPGAPQDEYLYTYEKQGQRKEFTPADAPAGNPEWTYIQARLVKPGYTPEINTFELYDTNGNNVADTILHHPHPLLLLIAPDLQHASDRNIDLINNAYDLAHENGQPFYALTASAEENITQWKKHTGADYPFLTADDVLLKTIIRSNPGLILLQHGTILAKWHHNDIPDENQLAAYINPHAGQTTPPGKKETAPRLRIISGFILPLLLIWVYDSLRNRKTRRKTNYKQ
jgi:hypothetical protein